MWKRSLVLPLVAGLCILAAASSASATVAACPPSFDTLTIDEAVALKISLGYPITPEQLEALLRGLDKNGDEIVCAGDMPDVHFPVYIANMLDNKVRVA